MQLTKVGFIGAGNMARALATGAIGQRIVSPGEVRASDADPRVLHQFCSDLGVSAASSNAELTAWADLLVLAVKPQALGKVLPECRDHLRPQTVVLSIVAGCPLSRLESALGSAARLVRAMPNVAASCGASASAVCGSPQASALDVERCEHLLRSVGRCVVVSEDHMDTVTGLSGSGPAYVLTVIEALADAGVREGLPRQAALELATQTVLGTARLLQESNDHPAVWRDRVTSPGGTTAAGLAALERCGLRHAMGEAVRCATERSRQLGAPVTNRPT